MAIIFFSDIAFAGASVASLLFFSPSTIANAPRATTKMRSGTPICGAAIATPCVFARERACHLIKNLIEFFCAKILFSDRLCNFAQYGVAVLDDRGDGIGFFLHAFYST